MGARVSFPAVFPIVCAVAWTCLAATPRAGAQVQEKKLAERLQNPDMTLEFVPRVKSFGSGKGYQDPKGGNAGVKEFYFTQRYSAKGFATKDYRAGNFWMGDFKFDTKRADVKASRDAGKTYATKSAEVKEAREGGKTYGTSTFAGTREHIERGKAQGAIDAEQKKGPKTIDDVRELLNKNK